MILYTYQNIYNLIIQIEFNEDRELISRIYGELKKLN